MCRHRLLSVRLLSYDAAEDDTVGPQAHERKNMIVFNTANVKRPMELKIKETDEPLHLFNNFRCHVANWVTLVSSWVTLSLTERLECSIKDTAWNSRRGFVDVKSCIASGLSHDAVLLGVKRTRFSYRLRHSPTIQIDEIRFKKIGHQASRHQNLQQRFNKSTRRECFRSVIVFLSSNQHPN
ncbi:hypothetical protein AVEN_203903-1 [Araneus ventricosus]|uniref:Uncharacterized protein n=1 Tax=Araneus ventricosus TaxID=182803 RepID=A0A4Y2CS31_ARAVE|nr:hypothetical protein AVEN_203903-1 [Araneus ventricosus]